MTKFAAHHPDHTVVDLASSAINGALRDANVDVSAVDELVFANESDHLSRQVTLGALVSSESGLGGKPVTRVEAGGATGAAALRTAASLLRSGDAEVVVVCGAEKTGRDVSGSLASEIFALSADSDLEFPMGVTFPALYALTFQAHMGLYGTTMEQVATVSVKNFRNGSHNDKAHRGRDISVADVLGSAPIASPYRAYDCSPLSDGAAAVVLATERWMAKQSGSDRPSVALVGSGMATASPRLGDRLVDGLPALANFSAKRVAGEVAYEQAEVRNPVQDIDVAEVYDSFSGAEVQAYEDLGFCGPGEGGSAAAEGRFDFGGQVVVNPSGGLIARGAASGATGLAQVYEVVTQLRGEAGDRQVSGARRGLTDTHAGVASICIVHVFERRTPRRAAA